MKESRQGNTFRVPVLLYGEPGLGIHTFFTVFTDNRSAAHVHT
jgi:hypothetical protein